MTHATVFTCVVCGREYPLGNRYVCDDHGSEGILDVGYDYDAIRTSWSKDDLAANPDPTMWRYRPLMPVDPDAPVPPISVGGTPTYDAPRLADAIGVSRVWVKDEGREPTASLKDRASSMAVTKAMEFGVEIITTASTGNAAAALSGVSASVGLSNVIFVPESAPEAKVAQLLAYGSRVALVKGNYDAAFELCLEAADRYGWYNRNTGFNPFMTEGKKTAMLELLEQLDWEVPDAVFVSVGDGSIIGGLHKGAKDLFALGWIDRMPRIFGIQSAGSDYLVQAFEKDEDVLTKEPISADTVADSISADLPRDRIKAMAAVRGTGGAYLRVADDDILAAIPEMARGSAVFGEPAGAAAWAGARAAAERGFIDKDDTVAVLNTGSGLKDVPSVMRGVESVGTTPMRVAPDIEALDAALQNHEE